jgi:hypothetical protein
MKSEMATMTVLVDVLSRATSPVLLLEGMAGVFYVNEQTPLAGGTGHTIRVCRELGVPVAFQKEWREWV